MNKKLTKTRFAPSPTGFMHIGGARALIIPWLFAKKNHGEFILRIDDTDTERSKITYEKAIFEDIKWLGLDFNYTFKQSENMEEYDKVFNYFKQHNLVYQCFETKEELEEIKVMKRLQKKAPIITKNDCKATTGESYWRFDLNADSFEFEDLIQGKFKFGRDWSDPIIKKPDGSYSYIFASVVDDINHDITHIIRGEEHIANTVSQISIGNQLSQWKNKKNWEVQFAHFSLFLDDQGHKISKRNLDTSLKDLKHLEPETFWSVISYLGTNHNQIFSLDINEYIQNFDINNFSKSKQKFSMDILNQTNKKIFHMKNSEGTGFNKEIFDLLLPNSDNREHLFRLSSQLQDFISKKNYLYDILLNSQDIQDIAIQLNKQKNSNYSVKDCCIFIYNEIFDQSSGPKIVDLVQFIKNKVVRSLDI